jgi:hypothetical protein
MRSMLGRAITSLCVVGAVAVCAVAHSAEVQEKPRLYTYVANWDIPRAHWEEMQKMGAGDQKILDPALANGTIVAYGSDVTLVHQLEGGSTHAEWWCANSMAGLLEVLDQFYTSKSAVAPVLAGANKHWDNVYFSRFYDWRAGPVKGGYVHGATYKLRADAPANAVDLLSKGFLVPLLEKLMADGSVTAYQVAEENVHTQDPSLFFIFFITPNAAGIDKVSAALGAAVAEQPLFPAAFGAMVDYSAHRDYLGRADAVFK